MLWCRTNSISKSPSQVCKDIFQIFLSKPSSLPQPFLQDKVWRLCFVVPVNSLKDGAAERAWSDTRESASSTSQNQRRLKSHRWADSSSKWKDRREEGIMGDAWRCQIRPACSSRPAGERAVQESPFIPNTVLLTFSPADRAQAVSPVTTWPDWRHCFLEQFSQTCRFFSFPLPCYTQVLPNPIKSVQFWLSERAAREVFGPLSSHVPARTVQVAHY